MWRGEFAGTVAPLPFLLHHLAGSLTCTEGSAAFFLHHASVHVLENHQLANSQESATPRVCPELRDVSIYRHLARVNDVFYSQNWLAAGFIPHPASFDGKPRPTESPYPDVDVASPNSLQNSHRCIMF